MNKKRILQACLGILWIALGVSSVVLFWWSGVSLLEVPQLLSDWADAQGMPRALGWFLLLYTLRPLVLFPSTAMGVASGLTFGPALGCLVTMTGELLGAGAAFSLARLLGRRWVQKHESARLARWDRRLSGNGLLSVCILRLIMLPFDSISYACGLTAIRLHHFLVGTFLGGLLYVLTITLLGGSAAVGLEGEVRLGDYAVSARTLVLMLSGLSFLAGLTIAWMLRRRYVESSEAGEPLLPDPQATLR